VDVTPLFSLLRALPDHGEIPALDDAQWTALLDLADGQGLSALLHHALGDRAPQAVRARLSSAHLAQVARALRLKRLNDFVLDGLNARGLTPVLLKGFGISSRYWPDWALRPSGDVDVLLEPDHIETAVAFLQESGFSEHADAGHPEGEVHTHHRGFTGKLGLVEVHFRALEGPGGGAIEGPELLARARQATLDGRAVRYLAPEDELVYLASHAAQHLFQRVAWIYDLTLLIRGEPRLDFERVAQVAAEAKLRASTHAGLVLASRLLNAKVPHAVLDTLAPSRLHARAVLATFTPERLESAAVASSVAAPALRALLADSPSGALRHLAQGTARRLKRAVRSRTTGGRQHGP
jgi:hypothetical protein